MKKIFLFVILIAWGTALSAQEAPVIPERETVVVDNFTAVPNLTLGMYQYARHCILEGLSRRRLDVLDVERDGYGRPDLVYSVLKTGVSGPGQPFDVNRVAMILNDYPQARWYVTVYISRIHCHPVDHQSKDKDGNVKVRTDFTAEIDTDLFLYDRETLSSEGPIHWKCFYSGASSPEYAEEHAARNLTDKAESFVSDRFRFKASVIQLGEYNRRGKLEDLYLSCGSDMGVSRGDVFYIYSVSSINGIETTRKLGKVKAREITGQESCRCTVSNGEEEINAAFLNNETLIAISDSDHLF